MTTTTTQSPSPSPPWPGATSGGAQIVVVAYLILILLIGVFYYPTIFGPRQQTVFGWFENDVYLGLVTIGLYLGIQRLRGVALV